MSRGVQPQSLVGVLSTNCADWVAALLGCQAIHAIPIGINFRLRPADLLELLPANGVNSLIVGEYGESLGILDDRQMMDFREADGRSDQLPDSFGRAAGQLAFFTGGTTGEPKVVLWGQESFSISLYRGFRAIEQLKSRGELNGRLKLAKHIQQTERVLVTQPLCHGSACHWVLSTLIIGHSVVLLRGAFTPDKIREASHSLQPSVVTVIGNAMALPLLEVSKRAPQMQFETLRSSGAHIAPSTIREILGRGLAKKVIVDLGATEIGNIGSVAFTSQEQVPESLELNLYDGVSLITESGHIASVGESGRVARRHWLATGYLSKGSLQDFRGGPDSSWGFAGDIAKLLSPGRILIEGRQSRFINSGGEKFNPETIESVLLRDPRISNCIVTAIPDPKWGEAVAAVVKTTSEVSPELLLAILEGLSGQLPRFMFPKVLVGVSEFPLLVSGKPDLRWAAQVLASGPQEGILFLKAG